MKKSTLRIKQIQVASCSPELYDKFRSLNLRDCGTMQHALGERRRRKVGQIFYVMDGDVVVAWNLVFPSMTDIKRSKRGKVKSTAGYEVHTYVRHTYRRRGLARRLLKRADKYAMEHGQLPLILIQWDGVSEKFFETTPLMSTVHIEHWDVH